MDYRERLYKSYTDTHFSYVSALTEEEYVFLSKILKKQLLTFIPTNKDADIVDLGCGPGHFLYLLQKEGYKKAMGVDISRQQIEMAQKAGIANLTIEDAKTFLTKYREKFDAIISLSMIEHLTKIEILEFLDLVYQSLKPGGILILRTPNASGIFGISTVFCDFTHEVGLTPTSISQVLRTCGFKDIKIYGEEPIAHDLRSAIRYFLWKGVKFVYKIFIHIERGFGRGIWDIDRDILLDSRMFAVTRKTL